MPHDRRLPVRELFVGIQGEGTWAGVTQVFVRLQGCNLESLGYKSCRYCDTPHSRPSPDHSGDASTWRWSTPEEVVKRVLDLSKGKQIHSVAFTGGEPLLYVNALAEVFTDLYTIDTQVYLETNGTMPAALGQLLAAIPTLDYIAMDIKLPTASGIVRSPEGLFDLTDLHTRFLSMIADYFDSCIKLVVTRDTPTSEIEWASRMMKNASFDVEDAPWDIVLQPVTRRSTSTAEPPTVDQLIEWSTILGRAHGIHRVFVKPQIHQLLGSR